MRVFEFLDAVFVIDESDCIFINCFSVRLEVGFYFPDIVLYLRHITLEFGDIGFNFFKTFDYKSRKLFQCHFNSFYHPPSVP